MTKVIVRIPEPKEQYEVDNQRQIARALRAIFEEILQDSMFNFPSEKNIEKVVVDENVVKNKEQPLKLLKKKIAN